MTALITQKPSQSIFPPIINNHIPVNTAAELTGYNIQYLRRLLRARPQEAMKIGQMRLFNLVSLDEFLMRRMTSEDRRCGPR